MTIIMKNLFTVLLSLILLLFNVSTGSVSSNAKTVSLEYNFAVNERGFAQGDIALTAPEGTYWLYWANDKEALRDYKEITKISFSSSSTQTHKMHERCAIPLGATKLIAINSEKEPDNKNVSSAEAVYDIPDERIFNHSVADRKYRFASYSDVHTDAVKKNYKYDETHWRKALDTVANRNAQFIVMSGDYINNNVNFEGISTAEWRIYQRVLSESSFLNPVYEDIGNHEIRQNPTTEMPDFIRATGLEGDTSSSDKAYFERDINGDHFIFMALEKGFRPSKKQEQFSKEQLDWVEGLLEKYSGDGKNIYIIEHALFYKYGAGDRIDDEPYYSLPLYDPLESTQRFKTMLEKYKDVIFLSGHTHIAFKYQYNFSDNGGTSAQMIHNSSVGGVRHIVDGKLNSDYKEDESEGYIVDVYNDAIIFNGANLYYNIYDPNCCYIVKPSNTFTGVQPAKDYKPDDTVYQLGDVNLDDKVNIIDVSLIQEHIAKMRTLNDTQIKNADVNFDNRIDVSDASAIQKYLVRITKSLNKPNDEKLRQEVSDNLKLYYRYSSYNSYQLLKKAYNYNLDDETLKDLNSKFLKVVDKNNVDKKESMNVYFENTEDWNDVYAYNWGASDKVKAAPGTKLKAVGKSENGKDIYKYTIPDKKYFKLRFTNGSDKTQDIRFYSGNICYYIYDKTTSLKVKGYKYNE
jgi:hypothetical protein